MEDTNIDMERATKLIENIEQDLRDLRQILGTSQVLYNADDSFFSSQPQDEGIEGYFDGERMVDEEGKTYQISANYASKSKLIEGDPLKLYITPEGKFFYKQLGPVERKTVPGTLRAEGNHYVVDAEDGQTYKILTASVTYYVSLFSLQVGDQVLLMIPAENPAQWAVIDNIL